MTVTAGSKKGNFSETTDWLTTPIEFEEQRGFRVSRNRMRLVVVLAAGALVWAALAPIREHSLARGQLIPESQVRPVQHLEGGIAEQILMKEGQIVEHGQPLMRLQTVMAEFRTRRAAVSCAKPFASEREGRSPASGAQARSHRLRQCQSVFGGRTPTGP